MHKYQYKGFEVSYDVLFSSHLNHYEAKGEVDRVEQGQVTYSKEFCTQVSNGKRAEKEIKTLMEDFIDFEWQQFNLLNGEFAKKKLVYNDPQL